MDAAIVNNADNNDVSIKHELTSSSSTKSLRSTASSAVSGLVRAASRGRLRQPQQEQQQSAGSRARSRGRGLVKGIGGAGGAVWRIGGTGGTGGVGGEIAGDTDAIAPLAPPADLASVSAPPASIEPDDWVALSIYYHENTPHLHVSAYYASLAAAAGSGVGLFLYAIALRHGLGVAQDSRRGLQLLCRAADAAMDAIENPSSTTSNSADPSSENHNQQHLDNDYPPPLLHSESFSSAAPSAFSETLSRLPGSGAVRHLAKRELAAALYEIANCYRNGWGVDAVSEPTALYYYTVASSLGDCDAHVALADCYMRGKYYLSD
ncbi:hypothetical protein HK100_001118 [Physocladia obscura]|uniref:Uncharacterized protein n=1 Tax=Physocladia obscura TaxID=109957 RepID=A0AAD5T8K6_9FUNG|nr:hypothetical protein HK100_001118 [Physocladia obscura]